MAASHAVVFDAGHRRPAYGLATPDMIQQAALREIPGGALAPGTQPRAKDAPTHA